MSLIAPDARSPRAPGTLAKHYAPRTPVILVEVDVIDELARSFVRQGKRVAVLAQCASTAARIADVDRRARGAGSLRADLYANLRRLDAAACAVMLVEAPPSAIASADEGD